MYRTLMLLGTSLSAVLLASCSGGDGGSGTASFPEGPCATLGGGVTVNAPTVCSSGCSDNNTPAAADNSFGTFATLTFNDVSSGTIGVTARGLNSDGGHFVGGVINLLENSTSNSNLTVRVSTLDVLGNVLETGPLQGSGAGDVFGDSDMHVVGFDASLPFDGIAIDFSRSAGLSSKSVEVTEFCRN